MAEGLRTIQQIIENGAVEVKALFFDESQKARKQDYWTKQAKKIDGWKVYKKEFQQICDTQNPQGVIALCGIPAEAGLNDMTQASNILLATDAIQDPGNMGTIIRTATWFGVSGMLVGKGSVDIFNPKTVRSTAGATGALPYQTGSLTNMLPRFEEKGWQVLLLDGSNDANHLKEITKHDKIIVVVGNEAKGIRSELFSPERAAVKIQSKTDNKSVESLNAAIATSIALYELC